MADWSKLPYDIIHQVSTHIDTTEDFLSFSAVCSSWRSVHVAKQWRPGPQVPWLMLPNNENIRSFLSLYRSKVYNLELPEAHGRRCWGSSVGWLVTIGRDLEINLLHAITRASIILPPITSLDVSFGEIVFWYDVIDKAFVFKKPQANEEDFLVVIIYGPLKQLAFCKPGNCSWKRFTDDKLYVGFTDATYFKDQLCAVNDTATLVVIDIDDLQHPKLVHTGFPPKLHTGFPLFRWGRHPLFLVELSGYLWLIYYHVKKFFTYTFDFRVSRWLEQLAIGNHAVFIGDCCSMSVRAPERLNCKSNSIYFVVNVNEEKWDLACDIGVYDMISGITDSLTDEAYKWMYTSHPLWVMPSLC